MYHTTETAQLADLVLPAAGWGEKEGTFINSERRIGLLQKVRRAPGQALADFHIFRLLAEYWGCPELFEHWKTPEDVFDTLKALSEGQPCDFSGIESYRMLDEMGGVQWPFRLEDAVADSAYDSDSTIDNTIDSEFDNERRLFEDGVFPRTSGRALFCFEAPAVVAESVSAAYPFALLTGRGSSSQWHTNTRTGKSAVLRKLYRQEAYCEICSGDAQNFGIQDGDTVRLTSRRGTMVARAVIAPTMQAGQIFVPMHYEGTNRLTKAVFDPYSRQPSYKHCAIRLERENAT
jgi:predicted molibdopterin-dependent oxidoreductase YjgC